MSINTSASYSVPADFDFIGAEHGAWLPTPVGTSSVTGITTTIVGWKNNSDQLVQWVNDNTETVKWVSKINSTTDVYDKYLVFPRKNILG